MLTNYIPYWQNGKQLVLPNHYRTFPVISENSVVEFILSVSLFPISIGRILSSCVSHILRVSFFWYVSFEFVSRNKCSSGLWHNEGEWRLLLPTSQRSRTVTHILGPKEIAFRGRHSLFLVLLPFNSDYLVASQIFLVCQVLI